MRLAKLKKKNKTDKDATKPTSGLALWEAKLAEQQYNVDPAGASPSSSPAASSRAAALAGRRMTLTGAVDNPTESGGAGRRFSSPTTLRASDEEDSDEVYQHSRSCNDVETVPAVDCEAANEAANEAASKSPHTKRSPRGKGLAKSDSNGGGGLRSRFSKSKSSASKDKDRQKLLAAEDESRRRAQIAALEIFKEKGSTYNYSVPQAYGGEGEVSDGSSGDLDDFKQKEQERQGGRGKRTNDVLIEIKDGRPQLRAGTFEEIVKWIIFNSVTEHVSSFLITFRAYGTPAELWTALMNVFKIIQEKDKMPILMKTELRKRTLDLLLEWIRRFSYKDFTDNGDTTLFKKLTKFIKSLPSEDANQFKLLFMRKKDDTPIAKAKEADTGSPSTSLKSSEKASSTASAEVSRSDQREKALSLSLSDAVPVSADLPASLHFRPPWVIAQQMTFLDAARFAEIQPEEMLLSNWTRPNKEEVAPTLTYLARQFNMWSGMVATDIILANSINEQVEMVKHYIRVLHHLYRLNNFQSLMAVISGLNCSSVSRLKRLWGRIPTKYTELFASMEQVMSPLGNFKYYRQVLSENRDRHPIVPYLVVFLRDLTFINDGNSERLMSEPTSATDMPRALPNFEKMVLLGQQILELEAYRKVPYDIEEVPAVTNMLKNVLYMDEDSLHRRSIEQEPIHRLNEPDLADEDETTAQPVVVKNPLVALKAISKDFKAASASDENDVSGDLSLSESTDDTLSATL